MADILGLVKLVASSKYAHGKSKGFWFESRWGSRRPVTRAPSEAFVTIQAGWLPSELWSVVGLS